MTIPNPAPVTDVSIFQGYRELTDGSPLTYRIHEESLRVYEKCPRGFRLIGTLSSLHTDNRVNFDRCCRLSTRALFDDSDRDMWDCSRKSV